MIVKCHTKQMHSFHCKVAVVKQDFANKGRFPQPYLIQTRGTARKEPENNVQQGLPHSAQKVAKENV